MKLLQVIASLDPADGGVADGVAQLSAIWDGWGHHVDHLTLDSPRAPYLAGRDDVIALGRIGDPDRSPGPRSFRERFGYQPGHTRWLRANASAYDAIVVHMLWNYSTVSARRALVGGSTPYGVFPHGSLDPWFRRAYPLKDLVKAAIWPFSEGVLCRHAAAVLFTTEQERIMAERRYWPYRIKAAVVGFGADDVPDASERQRAAFRRAVPALGDRPFLLFLSRIHPKKGCDLLLHAFGKALAARPDLDLDLVMAGPDQIGWRAELDAIAARHGIAHRVHWTGMIDGDVKWGAFRSCTAFILPSHTENFGIVVAEAVACGKPVLISDKVNIWREVTSCGAGLARPDTQAGADALIADYLAMSSVERSKLVAAARPCYERHFRMERTARIILNALTA